MLSKSELESLKREMHEASRLAIQVLNEEERKAAAQASRA